MKSNNIPRKQRLAARIGKLELKLDCMVPIRRGNPYKQCRHCRQSAPYLSIEGHKKGCSVPGWERELRYYKVLLEEEKQEGCLIEKMIKSEEKKPPHLRLNGFYIVCPCKRCKKYVL